MPQATAMGIRQVIVERHQQGETLAQIAERLALSPWTVRKVWRRYRDEGAAGLVSHYERCGRRGPRCERRVYRGALWLKRRHPRWGAGLIRVILQQHWQGARIPHPRTLQRWFRAVGIHQGPRQRVPREPVARGQAVHAVWEMDAKERLRLANGDGVSWLTVSDEKSGAVLTGQLFPPVALDAGGSDRRAGELTGQFPALGSPGQDPGG